jgi:hypothetical protein
LGRLCLINFGLIAFIHVLCWSAKRPSVGIPLGYAWLYILNYLIGAVAHALPWSEFKTTPTVTVGLLESTIGMGAFCVGMLAAAVLKLESLRLPWETVAGRTTLRLAYAYSAAGLIFLLVIRPVVIRIPSVGALASSGVYLGLAGLVALGYLYRTRGKARVELAVAFAALSFPLFTSLIMGFTTFGAEAAVFVFMALVAQRRPRWLSVVGMLLVGYLGISFYVTYLRDREGLRESVWGGEAMESRVDKMTGTLRAFEWFSATDTKHLSRLDGRLNHCFLIGSSVDYLGGGGTEFARGQTIQDGMLGLVPRIIWPEKPVVVGSGDLVSQYTGIYFPDGTSVGIGQIMEFYVNFGRVGVLIGMFILGFVIRHLDLICGVGLRDGDLPRFICAFVPALGLLNVLGSLVALAQSFASAVVAVWLVNRAMISAGLLEPRRARIPQASRIEVPAVEDDTSNDQTGQLSAARRSPEGVSEVNPAGAKGDVT